LEFIVNAAASFRGALVTMVADITTADYTTETAIPMDAEDYDTDDIHDTSTENTRMTVPAGVTRVRVSAAAVVSALTGDKWAQLALFKNGSAVFNGAPNQQSESAATNSRLNITSAVLTVEAADYFDVRLQVVTDTSITIQKNRTWLAMEIIE
jgi:hypothetical protein